MKDPQYLAAAAYENGLKNAFFKKIQLRQPFMDMV